MAVGRFYHWLMLVSTILLSTSPIATISDTPPATVEVEFSSSQYRVSESTREVIVNITIATDQDVNLTISSIEFKSSSSPAKAQTDFAVVPYELSLFKDETMELELGFPVYNDNLAEPCEEEFSIKVFSSDASVKIEGVSCVTVVILDDDDPTVVFGEDLLIVEEEEATYELPLLLRNVEGIEVEVSVLFIPGDVTREYPLPKQPTTAVMTSSTTTVALPLKDNIVYDGPRNGSFSVEYRALRSCLQRMRETTSIVFVRERDVVEFSFDRTSYLVNESQGVVSIEVVKTGLSAVPLDVVVTVKGVTATKDEDFIPPPPDYTLHFLPEENRKLYDVTIINDNIFEQNETFSMSIRALLNEGDISETELKTGNGDTVELPILITEIVRIENNVIVTIEDDDVLTVEFEQDSYQATMSTGVENITVLSSRESVVVATVRVTAEYEGAEGFPDQVQYVKITGMRTVVGVFVGPDGVYNPNAKWKVRMEVMDPASGVVLGRRSQTEIKIMESDTLLSTFMGKVFTAREADNMVIVKIQWAGKTAVPVKLRVVPYELNDTAHPARGKDDFSTTPVEFSISPDSSEDMVGSIPLSIVNDKVYEMTESFGVRLESDVEAVRIEPLSTVRVDIYDDESLLVGFNESVVIIEERVGFVNVCVDVVGMREVPLNILLTTPTSPYTTAIGGVDFENLNSTLTLQPSRDVQSVLCESIHIYDDDQQEENETFIVALETMKPIARVKMTAHQVTVVVTDNGDGGLPSTMVYRTCSVSPMEVTPFRASNATPTPYPISGVQCEHVVFRASSDGVRVEVLVDLDPNTKFGFRQLGLLYNTSLITVDTNGRIENIEVLGNSLSTDSNGDVYEGDIVVQEGEDGFSFHFRMFDLKVGTLDSNVLNIELAESSSLVANVNGLCGNFNGELVSPEEVVSEEGDEEFVRSWKVLRRALPIRSVCRRNITVTGDPVLTVPLSGTDMTLCFELRGRPDTVFNFISDTCLSVNTLYGGTRSFTFVKQVAIVAQDSSDMCHRILVDNVGCRVTVDDQEVDTIMEAGVVVTKRMKKIRISVPNCHHYPTIMWVTCKKYDQLEEDLLELFVVQGGSLTPSAHGVIGQFWNVPVGVKPYTEPDTYVITVPYPGASDRTFVGEWVGVNWLGEGPGCVYAGNSQGGPAAEFEEYNDPVIMGNYKQYAVSSLFEHSFLYSQFNGKCSKENVSP